MYDRTDVRNAVPGILSCNDLVRNPPIVRHTTKIAFRSSDGAPKAGGVGGLPLPYQ